MLDIQFYANLFFISNELDIIINKYTKQMKRENIDMA